MPTFDGTDIVVAGTGKIWVGAVGAAEPAGIATTPGAGWTELGYVSPDGVQFSFDRTVSDIFGWQSRDPLRTIITEEPKTISFSLMQIHEDTWKYAMGGGAVTSDGAAAFIYTPPAAGAVDERALMVEFTDGAKDYRIIYRRTMVNGAVTFSTVREDATVLPIEVRVLAPSAGTAAWVMQTNDAGFTVDV